MLESYHFFMVLGTFIIAYFISWYLVKTGKTKMMAFRKFWNFVLMISFLISGFIGLILAFLIDIKATIPWYGIILWLHVEFGILMAAVSLVHLFWHWQYYFKIKK